MASWQLVKVDNGKKTYTVRRNTGHEVLVTVPLEHHAMAQAYVEAVKAGHDYAIENPAKKRNWFKRLFQK